MAGLPQPSFGTSRVFYSYDGNGRLIRVCNALPGDGERTDYALDAADNRQNYANVKTDIAIFPNSGVHSGDGRFELYFQPDGNLVLYRNDGSSLWSSSTVGSGATQAYFQSDGNLVLYNQSGQSVWHSNTYNYPCAQLYVQNDGNAVIKSVDGQIVWQTGTGGH